MNSVHHINPKELERFVKNQADAKDAPPITERAVFKLSELKELIKRAEDIYAGVIQKNPQPNVDICVTFVRQKKSDKIKGYHETQYHDNDYSQLIPIMIPCLVNSAAKPSEFRYLRDIDGNVMILTPGGEGTGLIPPPPKSSGNPGSFDEDFG